LIASYPHADRNLNLECFTNGIFITDLKPTGQTFPEKMIEDKLDVKQEIKKIINTPKLFIELQPSPKKPHGSQDLHQIITK